MAETISSDICKLFVRVMQPEVLAFDAKDFNEGVIDCAKQANAQIYVDRLGDADNPETWQNAIDRGANGIQANLPMEVAAYLLAHNMASH
jgi:glycerophosphoryl diester phosphodiesterase